MQVASGFIGTWMPVTGLLAMPMLVSAFLTRIRKKVVPNMGDDVFSFAALQKSLVLSLVSGAVLIMFVLVLAVLLISRYAEFGFAGQFA